MKESPSAGTGGWDSLVEVGLGDLEEGAVAHGLDGEDERLAGEHGQLAHHLPGLRHEQTDCLLLVNHPLVGVQAARQHKVQTHVLWGAREE